MAWSINIMAWSIIFLTDLVYKEVLSVSTHVTDRRIKKGGNNEEVNTAHVL